MMETRSNFRIACLCEEIPNVEHAVEALVELSGQDICTQFYGKDTNDTCLVDILGVEPQEIDGTDIDLLLARLLNDEVIEWKMVRIGGTFRDEIDDWDDNDTYISEFCEQQGDVWNPFIGMRDKVHMPLDVPKDWHYYV